MALDIGFGGARKRSMDKFAWRSAVRPRSPTQPSRGPHCISIIVVLAVLLPALVALSTTWRSRKLVFPTAPYAAWSSAEGVPTAPAEPLPRLQAASAIDGGQVPKSVQREPKRGTVPPPRGLEPPPDGVYNPDAPLHAVNPTGPRFVRSDSNNPTRIERPVGGFPPRSLPEDHPQNKLLRRLRMRTQLSPRWPDHPELHIQALKSYGPAYASIIISDKLKVVYVPVFKVGTTSMMWNIAYLENNRAIINANISDAGERDKVLHDFTTNLWSNHAIYALPEKRVRASLNDPSYLKFAFVRNPYHRIVSAYLDKVVKWSFDSFEYQEQMYGLYGSNEELRALRNRTKPSFKQFMYAVEKVIAAPRAPSSDLTKENAYEDNNSRRDVHWRPQVELLHPDLIQFDFIGRFSRMDADKQNVLEWMYGHTERRMPTQRRRLHTTNPKDKVGLFKLLREDEQLRQSLLRTYKQDFDRFGFSRDIPSANEHIKA